MILRWLRSFFLSPKKFIGSDQFGNKYFENIKASGKKNRFYEANLKHEDYKSGVVPPEWEAWLSWRSHDPPKIEEIENRISNTILIKKRAAIKAEEDDKNQLKALEDGLIVKEKAVKETQKFQEKALPSKKSTEIHSSVGTSNTFEPEAWKPEKKS